jgi:hypothetical protein
LVLDRRAAEFEREVPFGVVVDALNDYLGGSGPLSLQLGGALLAAGDASGARSELVALNSEPSRRLLDLGGAHGWVLLTEAHLALGELDAAQDGAVRA